MKRVYKNLFISSTPSNSLCILFNNNIYNTNISLEQVYNYIFNMFYVDLSKLVVPHSGFVVQVDNNINIDKIVDNSVTLSDIDCSIVLNIIRNEIREILESNSIKELTEYTDMILAQQYRRPDILKRTSIADVDIYKCKFKVLDKVNEYKNHINVNNIQLVLLSIYDKKRTADLLDMHGLDIAKVLDILLEDPINESYIIILYNRPISTYKMRPTKDTYILDYTYIGRLKDKINSESTTSSIC